MKYLIFAVSLILLLSSNISAQNKSAIQLSGGLLLPQSSSNGVNVSLQYNYYLNDDFLFYVNTGYLSWDRFYVHFNQEWSVKQKETRFRTYTSDTHTMIPINIGGRLEVRANELFNTFVSFEAGYSYLSYNSYNVYKEYDSSEEVVTTFKTDRSSQKEIEENLISIGAGLGIYRRVSENLELLLQYRLYSHLNSEHYDAFSSHAIFSSVNFGVNYLL